MVGTKYLLAPFRCPPFSLHLHSVHLHFPIELGTLREERRSEAVRGPNEVGGRGGSGIGDRRRREEGEKETRMKREGPQREARACEREARET